VSGSFVYGLSALFYGECTIRGGRVEQENFDTYNSMRIAEMPQVETIIMPAGHTPWGGVGEPTICVAASAVLNACFNATGKRIRSIPLKNHGIRLKRRDSPGWRDKLMNKWRPRLRGGSARERGGGLEIGPVRNRGRSIGKAPKCQLSEFDA
jgi:hypothetical protein